MINYVVYYRVKRQMMQTKDIVKKTNLDRETLRFYEERGLLPKLSRTKSGYRIYSEKVLSRIKFIQKAKEAGFTLSEIKSLIDLQQNKKSCRIGRDLAKIKKTKIKEKISALKKMDKILDNFILECEKNGQEGLSKPCHFSFETNV